MDSRYFTLIKGDRDEILEAVHKAIVSYVMLTHIMATLCNQHENI